MRDLLPIQVEISEPEEPEGDLLSEAIKSTMFDSQLYLFETVGILTSVTSKNPEQQGALLLSLVKPLMEELSTNLQLFTAGTQDLVPVVKVHHIIMALGNISKGFPDYPATVPENYMAPAVKVFAEVAQAILVCLEAMNILKPIRDAVCSFPLSYPMWNAVYSSLCLDSICLRSYSGYCRTFRYNVHSTTYE